MRAKTGQPLHFTVPKLLVPYLEAYLERVRPTFLKRGKPEPNGLWLGFEGRPLTQHSVYLRFIYITKRLLGSPINPHLLRDCAATTLSTKSPDDALTAAALLGHRNFGTTERYYIRANQLEARAIVKSCVWVCHAAARSWRSPFTNLTPRMISAN